MKIALHGYARSGKDEVGKILMRIEPRFVRVAMGDLIKEQLDPLIKDHLGFSAFTENDAEKTLIRNVLVHWGYANYKSLLDDLMLWAGDHEFVVNTRIFRAAECRAWIAMGGQVWEVIRPEHGPAEPKEAEELAECKRLGLIATTLHNNGTLENLEWAVRCAYQALVLNAVCPPGH